MVFYGRTNSHSSAGGNATNTTTATARLLAGDGEGETGSAGVRQELLPQAVLQTALSVSHRPHNAHLISYLLSLTLSRGLASGRAALCCAPNAGLAPFLTCMLCPCAWLPPANRQGGTLEDGSLGGLLRTRDPVLVAEVTAAAGEALEEVRRQLQVPLRRA